MLVEHAEGLREALDTAWKHLEGCCAETLAREMGAESEPPRVRVDAGEATLLVTIHCACGKRSTVRTDGISTIVETLPAGNG